MRSALSAITLFLLCSLPASAEPARIAIIIDDLGYQLKAGLRAVDLPGAVAYAVLPETPRGRTIAEYASENGKDVLLHLPLEADEHLRDEPVEIRHDMDQDGVTSVFATALAAVPHAIAVSSHQGSRITRESDKMTWLMQAMACHEGLFFVDSFTTHESVALEVADSAGVPAIKRDVFLDHDRTPEGIEQAFQRLVKLAQSRGVAVGIGHPYPETLTFLETALSELDAYQVELIPLGEALKLMNSENQADSNPPGVATGAKNEN